MHIPTSAPADIQQAFRDLYAIVAPLDQTRAINWKSRRLTQLGAATDVADAITKGAVDTLIASVRADALTTSPGPVGAVEGLSGRVRVGTYAMRGAAAPHAGELFVASDRNYVAWVSTGSAWNYVAGLHVDVIANKPTLLTGDAGYQFAASDFARIYRWSGSAWADAPGQPARGQIVFFDADPGTGWHLCDGTAGVTKSTATAGTTTLTMPNLTSANRFLRATSGATGGTGGSATTHTHQVDPPNTTTTTDSLTQLALVNAGGSSFSPHGHTHDVDIAAFASAAPSGTSGDDALPPYISELPYYRL